jgi:hypothetical protein
MYGLHQLSLSGIRGIKALKQLLMGVADGMYFS